MPYSRLIPCLDVANGRVVKGVSFVGLRDVGDPVELAKIEQILRFAAVQRMVKGRSSSGLTE